MKNLYLAIILSISFFNVFADDVCERRKELRDFCQDFKKLDRESQARVIRFMEISLLVNQEAIAFAKEGRCVEPTLENKKLAEYIEHMYPDASSLGKKFSEISEDTNNIFIKFMTASNLSAQEEEEANKRKETGLDIVEKRSKECLECAHKIHLVNKLLERALR